MTVVGDDDGKDKGDKDAEDQWINGIAMRSSGLSSAPSAQQEALSYLVNMDRALNTYPDILSYWQTNGRRWPQVIQVVYNVLLAHGSSMPCECLFSSAKLTKTDLRNQITPELMEACQILKYGFRHKDGLDFTGYMKDKAMLQEMQMSNLKDDEMPKDISTTDYVSLFCPLGERPQRHQASD
ncbi:hypothetical protein PQX77_019559 [Marasmius sp. AFHP31]|nr:hypothetical protein PQX77_019559 [Marasmius sp. AFHP31]